MKRTLLLALAVTGVLLAVDQTTKVLVESAFALGESVPVCPHFNLTYVRNEGCAWGMLQGAQYWLAGFAVAAVILCLCFWRVLFGLGLRAAFLGGLLLSGIIGNCIDRLRLGYVVDFFDFYWGRSHFPCFNVADSAICAAVFLMILLPAPKPAKDAQ